jgi:DNA/RNA-binding domain of Phe-tRNA-synthetase-like protein
MRKIIVDGEIFEKFPDFKRGVILISDAENAAFNEGINRILQEEITKKRVQNLLESEFVKAWEEAHLKFGSNPNKFPPSIKSLLKRIEKGGKIPFINSIVALFNYVSLKYLIPCGGDDVDKIEGNLRLGFSNGNEVFIPLGATEKESPEAGEVIYFDDKSLNVMCRKWNWRNGDFSKITESTKKLVINLDAIGPVLRELVEQARDELQGLLVGQCRAKAVVNFLDKDNREINIDF